jgi:hypothetical protein
MWMFFDRELTATEAQKLNVNMYKWYVDTPTPVQLAKANPIYLPYAFNKS